MARNEVEQPGLSLTDPAPPAAPAPRRGTLPLLVMVVTGVIVGAVGATLLQQDAAKEPARTEQRDDADVTDGGFSLGASLPDGWFRKESITLLSPDGQANVIFSSEPLDPTIDSEQYAETQGELLRKEFPDYDERSFEAASVFGGRRGYVREFEWTPPDGVSVRQIQQYYAADQIGYTATSTTPSDEFDRVEEDLRAVLDGLTTEAG